MGVVQRTGAGSKPHNPVLFLNEIVTTGRLLRTIEAAGTIFLSNLSLSHYSILVTPLKEGLQVKIPQEPTCTDH